MERDRSRSPPAPKPWPLKLGSGHRSLDLVSQEELESLRLEVRELWRRVRALEADGNAYVLERRVNFLEHIATTAQRRWRILRG